MATYEVLDLRPEICRSRMGVAKHVGTLRNVPDDLLTREMLARYGIAGHLRVLRADGDRHVVVQHGRT